MKIDPSNSIRITGASIPAESLRAIPRGAEIPARILERLGPREAILEMAGSRVRAEFLKGVPPGDAITLRLEEAGRTAFLFKMVDPAAKEELARLIRNFILPGKGVTIETIMHGLNAALGRSPAGILELNALLLGRNPRDLDRGTARFLGHLLRLGASAPALGDLSVILSGLTSAPPPSLRALLKALGFEERPPLRRRGASPGAAVDEAVGGIMAEIEAIDDPAEREGVTRGLLDLLSDRGGGETSGSGEFPFLSDDEVHPVRYLESEGSWLFSVEFSRIGPVEVLAGEAGASRFISVFARDRDVLDALEKSSGDLERSLKRIDPSIHINFYTTVQAINKMVEINSHYSIHSVFDIRV